MVALAKANDVNMPVSASANLTMQEWWSQLGISSCIFKIYRFYSLHVNKLVSLQVVSHFHQI